MSKSDTAQYPRMGWGEWCRGRATGPTRKASEQVADDYLNIGSTPPEESCAQVGSDDYYERSRAECAAYATMLQRIWSSGDFRIKRFEHDFGSYYEVVAYFNPDDEHDPRAAAAYEAEADGPQEWDDKAWRELGEKGFGKEYLNA